MQRRLRHILPAVLGLVLAGAALAQNGMDERGIYVSGVGTVYGEPDLAILDLGVTKADEDLSLAIAGANEAMRDIIEALVQAGVDKKDIRTTDFNIWREERRSQDNEALPALYHVDNTVEVTVREVSAAGSVLDAAIEAGANEVRSVRYTFANPDELKRKARELAMQDARSTAEQLAGLAGVGLGPVREIRESAANPPMPYFAERSMAMAADAVPVTGGQLAVSVSLSVTFEIDYTNDAEPATGGSAE